MPEIAFLANLRISLLDHPTPANRFQC